MVTFWTTRVGPMFELFFAAELLLSGRLVPLSLMPEWAQRLADVPAVPVDVRLPDRGAVGDLPPEELLGGLAMQVLWIVIGASLGADASCGALAVRRYRAVGG